VAILSGRFCLPGTVWAGALQEYPVCNLLLISRNSRLHNVIGLIVNLIISRFVCRLAFLFIANIRIADRRIRGSNLHRDLHRGGWRRSCGLFLPVSTGRQANSE
jgi:hypothetical protein